MTTAPAPEAPVRGWGRFVGDMASPPEHSLPMRLACLVAVVAAATSVLANDVGGPFMWFVALVAMPGASVVSYLRRHNANPVVPALLTLITVVLALRFLFIHRGAASPAELRIPLAELLVTLEAIRSFSLRSRRELRFALASSLALISVGGALSLSIAFAPFAAVWGIAAVTALALGYRSELGALAPTGPSGSRAARPSMRSAFGAFAAVTAVASIVFLTVPAARSSRLLAFASRLPDTRAVPTQGGLSNPTLGDDDPARPESSQGDGGEGPASFGYFGFSNRLDTSLRGRPDETLVMRVRAASPDFWRGQTFDRWDGRSWTLSDERTVPIRGRDVINLLDPLDEPSPSGEEMVQTYYLETAGPNLIFAANRPVQIYLPQSTVFELPDGSVRTGVELDHGAIYTVVSRRPHATRQALRAAGDGSTASTPAGIVARYTQLPATVPDRVRQLARDVASDLPTTYDKVLALEAWMAANTQYRLDIPPLPEGADSVDQFLFVDRVGFCEQIGSSLVVMLRSLGIPARLAVGYAPGERNPFTGVFEVRAKDAHAWAEVYFPGIGWQGFDPTAQVPLSGEPQTDAARVGLRDYLGRHLPKMSPLVLAVVLAGAVGGALAMWWKPISAWWSERRRRRGWADVQLTRLEEIGGALGRPRDGGETAREYAAALRRTVLRDPRLDAVGDALSTDAFAPAPLSDDERRRVEELIGAIADG